MKRFLSILTTMILVVCFSCNESKENNSSPDNNDSKGTDTETGACHEKLLGTWKRDSSVIITKQTNTIIDTIYPEAIRTIKFKDNNRYIFTRKDTANGETYQSTEPWKCLSKDSVFMVDDTAMVNHVNDSSLYFQIEGISDTTLIRRLYTKVNDN